MCNILIDTHTRARDNFKDRTRPQGRARRAADGTDWRRVSGTEHVNLPYILEGRAGNHYRQQALATGILGPRASKCSITGDNIQGRERGGR